MKTALLASYEKDAALLRLGKMLTDAGWNLLGSAGTAKYLNENGIPCKDISDKIGKPILGHKVVTLSRKIHAGLLANNEEDFSELKELKIDPIDLVYVTLYPLEKTIESGASGATVIENTDMGGPAMLRSAAKGRRIVLSSPGQLDEFEKRLKSGTFHEKYTLKLAAAAERKVADYVAASAAYWEKQAA